MTDTTVKKPRKKPAEERREDLMDAAQTLFLQKGFAATNVSEIVAGAEVAKGTFYTYFNTKDEILAALRVRYISDFHQTVVAALGQCAGSWPDRLDTCMSSCVAAYLQNVPLHDLVFHEYRPANRSLKSDNPVTALLAGVLKDGMAAGAWHVPDPHLSAVMLFSAFHGAVEDTLSRDQPVDEAGLTKAVSAFCRNALGAERL